MLLSESFLVGIIIMFIGVIHAFIVLLGSCRMGHRAHYLSIGVQG